LPHGEAWHTDSVEGVGDLGHFFPAPALPRSPLLFGRPPRRGRFRPRPCIDRVRNGPPGSPRAVSYKYPGPAFEGFENGTAEASYYTWVDQHNTVGLGENVPISTANLNDGFVGLKDGQMVMLRIPYPLGFFAKGLDGRIDDPNAGWKGRGLWSTNGDRTPWLKEGGKGSKPRAVHIQVRPDPLAH
jgi:hypothetical protein